MGRIVNLKNYITGEMIPSFCQCDKVTNELVSMRAQCSNTDEIKGVKLNKEQKHACTGGKRRIPFENMISTAKIPFPQLFRSTPTRKV